MGLPNGATKPEARFDVDYFLVNEKGLARNALSTLSLAHEPSALKRDNALST